VQGIDVTPGDGRVVLHVRAFVDVDGSADRLDRADPEAGFDCYRDPSGYLVRPRLGDWSPGSPLQLLPADAARPLPAGASVMIEVRYGRIGNRVLDRTRVSLIVQEKRPRYIVHTKFLTSQNLDLPADQWSIRAEDAWTVDQNFTLLSLVPFMTDLGTDFKATLSVPGGETLPLVWVHDYDPQWQISYTQKEPLLVRAGSRVVVSAEFDNFETNPRSKKGMAAKGQFALGLEYLSASIY
jgi:hypothetical protein